MPAPCNLALTFFASSPCTFRKYISRPSTSMVEKLALQKSGRGYISRNAKFNVEIKYMPREFASCKFIFGYLFILRKHVEETRMNIGLSRSGSI